MVGPDYRAPDDFLIRTSNYSIRCDNCIFGFGHGD